MVRKLSVLVTGTATLVATVVLAGPAGAGGTGCPQGGGWTLAPVSWALPEIDNGNYGDQNGDGLGCYKVNNGQTRKLEEGGEAWTWKDNTNPS